MKHFQQEPGTRKSALPRKCLNYAYEEDKTLEFAFLEEIVSVSQCEGAILLIRILVLFSNYAVHVKYP